MSDPSVTPTHARTSQIFRLGDTGPAVAEIRARLAVLGLVHEDTGTPESYDATLDRAVRAFQQAKGLPTDAGRYINMATVKALGVAP